MKIVDNFLPEPFFKKLEGAWCDGDIPWCYNQGSTYNKKREWAGPSQFTHIFYSEDPWHRVRSPYYDLVKIIPDLLGAKKIIELGELYNQERFSLEGVDIILIIWIPHLIVRLLYITLIVIMDVHSLKGVVK